ncbi:hypothetical protein G6F68_012832 [Rhizopus microsporus]|nr:hypothetical protein G6F68_012832 [Rhizopus microsporus]
MWKSAAGTGAIMPASPPSPPVCAAPVGLRPWPLNSALKLMALTSPWIRVPSSWRMPAGLTAMMEASPSALPEPANARPRPLALFSFNWNAAALASAAASAPATPTASRVKRAMVEAVCIVVLSPVSGDGALSAPAPGRPWGPSERAGFPSRHTTPYASITQSC